MNGPIIIVPFNPGNAPTVPSNSTTVHPARPGNDPINGGTGSDTYILRVGSGHDTINEARLNTPQNGAVDKIKVMGAGITWESIVFGRIGYDLKMGLRDKDTGEITDSITVKNHFNPGTPSARVEKVIFPDGKGGVTEKDMPVLNTSDTQRSDYIFGTNGDDVFDANNGGDDHLIGYGGNDTFLLGAGTGHDKIYKRAEFSTLGVDTIRVKSGFNASNVKLVRHKNGQDLVVQLVRDGRVTDSLTVLGQYGQSVFANSLPLDKIVFEDDPNTVWTWQNKIESVALHGGAGHDRITGGISATSRRLNDTFDSNGGGGDHLYGYGGNDTYLLGGDTDHDTIHESSGYTYLQRSFYVGGIDTIRIKSGYDRSNVSLSRSGNDLVVMLEKDGDADSLIVREHFTNANARVESITFADGHAGYGVFDMAGAARNDAGFHRTINVNASNGTLKGGAGNDTLNGDARNNRISGGKGNDMLNGGAGDDTYYFGVGDGYDIINENGSGSAGDKIQISGVPSGVIYERVAGHTDAAQWNDLLIHLTKGYGSESKITDTLRVVNHFASGDNSRVESVTYWKGTSTHENIADTRITGTGGNESVGGSRGADIYDTVGGNDRLHGAGGNDVFYLGHGTGHDIFFDYYFNHNGGDSGDQIRIKSDVEVSSVRLMRDNKTHAGLMVQLINEKGEVTDSMEAAYHFVLPASRVEHVIFENADGTDGLAWGDAEFALIRTVQEGWAANETFTGDNGHDVIYGGGGKDTLTGNAGNDWLYGDGGNDEINGGAGNDHLYGGEGNDTLKGGEGNDVYSFAGFFGNDTIDDAGGTDTIFIDDAKHGGMGIGYDGNDLRIRMLRRGGEQDLLIVKNYLTSGKVEKIMFGRRELDVQSPPPAAASLASLSAEIAVFQSAAAGAPLSAPTSPTNPEENALTIPA